MSKIILGFVFCILVSVNSRVINMYTNSQTDILGNTIYSTSFGVPNRGPNGWDQLLGSTTDQSLSYASTKVFNVEPKWGDSIRDMNNPGVWYKTGMAGQINEICHCGVPGQPCSCYNI